MLYRHPQTFDSHSRKNNSNSNIKPDLSIPGKYEVNTNVFIDIKYENDQLTGQATGQARQNLFPDSKNVYKIGTTGDKVIFLENLSDGSRQLEIVQKQGSTIAKKLDVVSPESFSEFLGGYYNSEQKATYLFFLEKGSLWFKVGTNPPEKAEIFKKYDRLHFSYQNLENATIEFNRNNSGKIEGFTLSSGRVAGLKFTKK